jgi:hypothetical protein
MNGMKIIKPQIDIILLDRLSIFDEGPIDGTFVLRLEPNESRCS